MSPICCPACGEMTAQDRHLCMRCGAAAAVPRTLAAQRACLEELRLAIAAIDDRGDDPMTAAQAQDRLLRGGYLPDDCELLLIEADWCMRQMSGDGGYSSAAGARYQACVNKHERLRLSATAADAATRTGVIRRRRLLWRIAARAPVRPALQLLFSLATLGVVRFGRLLRSLLPVGKVAAPSHAAAAKIPL